MMPMDEQAAQDTPNKPEERQPFRVRLPGFVSDKEIGLGDVIKRATASVGVRPCGSCEQRAALLNRWVTFSGRPR
jgi:hypothetical protein